MPKDDMIITTGKVLETLANSLYKVELEHGHIVMAYPCGKMRKFSVRILPGDTVSLEMSPYDLTKGRITYRNK